MGIDVYLRWDGQTKAEEKAQYTGFDTCSGHVGYLREEYHGGPYATKILVAEGWGEDEVHISATTLRERLPAALEAVKERARKLYREDLADDSPLLQAYRDFVELADRKEAAGLNPRVHVSA